MKVPKIEEIIKASGIHSSKVFNIYIFGSRVYGNYKLNSDWDIIMVANNSVESTEIRRGLFNIHVYVPDKFKKDLDWHRINNLECIYAPNWAVLKEDIDYRKDFKINSKKIRHSISHTSSNSWVKCKKKLLVANEYNVGIKSLFHSIRIPMFGKQIMESNQINDFTCANWVWSKILSKRWAWEELNNEFKELHNEVLSDFRKLAKK